jgi:hypothetical protein
MAAVVALYKPVVVSGRNIKQLSHLQDAVCPSQCRCSKCNFRHGDAAYPGGLLCTGGERPRRRAAGHLPMPLACRKCAMNGLVRCGAVAAKWNRRAEPVGRVRDVELLRARA